MNRWLAMMIHGAATAAITATIIGLAVIVVLKAGLFSMGEGIAPHQAAKPAPIIAADAGGAPSPAAGDVTRPQAEVPAQFIPEPFVRLPQIELFFRDDYPSYWRHRAVALGPYGVIGAAFREPSADAAITAAEQKCIEKLQWHPIADAHSARCRIIALDGAIGAVEQAAEGGAAAHGLTWRTAQPAKRARGILLHLAECGAKAWREWHETWVDLLAANDWSLATLGSPGNGEAAGYCGETRWQRDAAAGVWRAHLATTIERLSKSYPNAELAIWADGAAGDVIHAAEFASGRSIITTNAGCGYAGGRRSLLTPDATVTALTGTTDLRLEAEAREGMVNTIAELCRAALAHLPKLSHHAIDTRDRFGLWRTEVMDVVAGALKLQAPTLQPQPASTLKYLPYEAQLTYNRSFRLHSFHRAFVISTKGRMFFSDRHASTEEAIRAAIYRCQKNFSGNGFARSRDDACALFAKDDEILIR